MNFRLFTVVAATALLAGCSAVPAISVSSHTPTPPVYEGGTAVFHTGTQCSITVWQLSSLLSYEVQEWPAFEVEIVNHTAQNVDLSAACFAAFSGSKKVPVLLRAEYAEQIRSAGSIQGMHQFMHDSGALLTSMRTPASNRPVPSATSAHVATRSIVSTNRVAESHRITTQMALQSTPSAQPPRHLTGSLESMLCPSQIAPGASVRGYIRLDAWTVAVGRPLRLVVMVAGETQEIVLDITR